MRDTEVILNKYYMLRVSREDRTHYTRIVLRES